MLALTGRTPPSPPTHPSTHSPTQASWQPRCATTPWPWTSLRWRAAQSSRPTLLQCLCTRRQTSRQEELCARPRATLWRPACASLHPATHFVCLCAGMTNSQFNSFAPDLLAHSLSHLPTPFACARATRRLCSHAPPPTLFNSSAKPPLRHPSPSSHAPPCLVALGKPRVTQAHNQAMGWGWGSGNQSLVRAAASAARCIRLISSRRAASACLAGEEHALEARQVCAEGEGGGGGGGAVSSGACWAGSRAGRVLAGLDAHRERMPPPPTL